MSMAVDSATLYYGPDKVHTKPNPQLSLSKQKAITQTSAKCKLLLK